MTAPRITSGIYAITHTASGRRYIGKSVNITRRWQLHRWYLRNNRHHCGWLQNAWNKYGQDAFLFEIVEDVTDFSQLAERECFWIANTPRAFNNQRVAPDWTGLKHSPATIERMRDSAIRANTPEVRAKKSAAFRKNMEDPEKAAKRRETILRNRSTPQAIAGRARKGRTFTDETKAKISQAAKSRTKHSFTGRHHTEETKRQLSEAHIGKPLSPEHRAAIAAAGIGRHPTPETRAKLTEAQLRRPRRSAETRAKMSQSQRDRAARGGFQRGPNGKFLTS